MKTSNVKKKVIVFMVNNDLDIMTMAAELAKDGDAKPESVRTMLSDMLNGRRYIPKLAQQIREKYGLDIPRPPHLQPIKPRRLPKAA